MDENRAPLYEKLAEHSRRRPLSFHVPGHKSGQGLDERAEDHYASVMAIDLTEITGLDDLHQPEEAIDEAQKLAAQCFGAEMTFFLVNGSTVGNLAMLMSLCGKGDLVLVQRNVHKSVIHALMLAEARAVFITPQMDELTGLATGVSAGDAERALRAYPEAKGLLITNPNYYGMGVRVSELAELAHQYGKPLLVDEAHGAHYGFHPGVPPSALSEGADVVVQSTHKMLTSMTMSAMLHVQGPRIDRTGLRRYLSMLQSSSPSYPLMASLDLARRQMATQGEQIIDQALQHIRWFTGQMSKLPSFRAIGEGMFSAAVHTKDPFKVAIEDLTGTLNGYKLQERLEARDCFCEMADPRHVLLVFGLGSHKRDAEKLFQVFCEINAELRLDKKELMPKTTNIYKLTPQMSISAPVSFSHSAARRSGPTVRVPIDEAVQRFAAELIIPYPPGIPILYPGEQITPETAEYLGSLTRAGAKFHGNAPDERCTIAVFAQC
ncbi:aminotransferase class I/II-fold pyridoxal phosphate-dependent enzyme [Paenibacillus thalictri]|uniref:Aminotransferase class I/II-fold pyridoxal phosphate-dependent enzyme n=1 Tax=Paenibacillus thalictri TaxID=2527873 RepID=A0A4Q9DEQ9_9BACL|nr:aminotransferase class I/II-fold pyridoxal phosphate-dependent enzyme [Paenibacillus thalictri]TBL68997.1 aminotransferase class I/II-fold pyridoxal phosphate-dependent enzyme [Paenibacillus thalictri]